MHRSAENRYYYRSLGIFMKRQQIEIQVYVILRRRLLSEIVTAPAIAEEFFVY